MSHWKTMWTFHTRNFSTNVMQPHRDPLNKSTIHEAAFYKRLRGLADSLGGEAEQDILESIYRTSVLVNALQQFIDTVTVQTAGEARAGRDNFNDAMRRARAAIAKATGDA